MVCVLPNRCLQLGKVSYKNHWCLLVGSSSQTLFCKKKTYIEWLAHSLLLPIGRELTCSGGSLKCKVHLNQSTYTHPVWDRLAIPQRQECVCCQDWISGKNHRWISNRGLNSDKCLFWKTFFLLMNRMVSVWIGNMCCHHTWIKLNWHKWMNNLKNDRGQCDTVLHCSCRYAAPYWCSIVAVSVPKIDESSLQIHTLTGQDWSYSNGIWHKLDTGP